MNKNKTGHTPGPQYHDSSCPQAMDEKRPCDCGYTSPLPRAGRTVAELAAGLARGDYNGSERFLTYSPERAAAPDLLDALKAATERSAGRIYETDQETGETFIDMMEAAIAKAEGAFR